MYRMVLECRSLYARDGRGVFVRHAARFDGRGPVFVRQGERLLVGEPAPGETYERTVGWVLPLDAASLVGTGEWRADDLMVGPDESKNKTPEATWRP